MSNITAEPEASPPELMGDAHYAGTKSGVQKRFDQLTRQKYEYQREAETLRAETAELRSELQQAKGLLRDYRAELEKYRSKFIAFATKEKHVG